MVWSKDEIAGYKEVRRKELGPTYATAGIGIDEPERRAEYLAGRLNLTPADHEVIMGNASKEGKVKALKMLEDMAIEVFF